MIRGIIFDCFGVLYVDVSQAYFSRYPQFHDELYDLNKMSDHGFIDQHDYIARVAEITRVSAEETLRGFMGEYTSNKELVDYIRTDIKPRYKVGLLSNIGRGWMQNFFDEYQLHDMFDEVVLSSEEGLTKPNPILFERTAERLGISPDECLMIDDKKENIEGAREAGMQTVLYVSNKELMEKLNALKS
jgi:HAD superfamily hydrolase (TIGR01549 family)